MRQIGHLKKEHDAQRFADFLLTEGIAAHTEAENDMWVVWVRNEDHLGRALEAFEQFSRSPEQDRYQGVSAKAQSIRQDEHRRREQAKKHTIEMQGRWNQAAARRAPLVMTMIAISVLATLFSNMGGNQSGWVMRNLSFCNYRHEQDPAWNAAGADGLIDIKHGQAWRVVTPIFLHGSILHLVFNMYMLFQLAGPVEDRRGALRLGLLVLVLAVVPNLAQYFVAGHRFLGMSGVVYGVFGYSWMKALFEPRLGIQMRQSTVIVLIVWFFLCFTTLVPHIANAAHAAGLIMGIAIGYVPTMFKQS